jgi:uncharacterized membrane protein
MNDRESNQHPEEEPSEKPHSVRRVRETFDERGKLIREFFSPLMVDFRINDVLEIIVGASVLAIPVAYTEEVWVLGEQLPLANIIGVLMMSLTIVALFVYYIFYRGHLRGNVGQFLLRVFAGYGITLLVVVVILTMFQKLPWQTDPAIAIRRIILVAFPASFSATVIDSLR